MVVLLVVNGQRRTRGCNIVDIWIKRQLRNGRRSPNRVLIEQPCLGIVGILMTARPRDVEARRVAAGEILSTADVQKIKRNAKAGVTFGASAEIPAGKGMAGISCVRALAWTSWGFPRLSLSRFPN